jgi:hypothetical protein
MVQSRNGGASDVILSVQPLAVPIEACEAIHYLPIRARTSPRGQDMALRFRWCK